MFFVEYLKIVILDINLVRKLIHIYAMHMEVQIVSLENQ